MSKTRKILTTLTMVAVATTTSLTAISSAQAHWTGSPHLHWVPPPPPPPPPHHHGGLRRGEAAALGAVGGLLVGTMIANANRRPVQQVQPAGLPAAHYAYCDAKYRSYVIATNTFTGYDGRQHLCFSPYVR